MFYPDDRAEVYRINERTKNENPRNALLTERQRELLQGDGAGISKESQKAHLENALDRLFNTFLDFAIIYNQIDEGGWLNGKIDGVDVEDVVSPTRTKPHNGEVLPYDVLPAMFALIYSMTYQNPDPYDFDTILKRAILDVHGGGGPLGLPPEIEFSVEDRGGRSPVDTVRGKIEQGGWDELSESELRLFVQVLLQNDETPNEEYADKLLFGEMFGDDSVED